MSRSLISLACILVFIAVASALTINVPLDTRVYFAGSFTTLNGTTYNNVAFYSLKEQVIKSMGNGTDGIVNVIHADVFGNVYIGGTFTQVGSVRTGPVAVWNIHSASWISAGITATAFTQGSTITSIDTNCASSIPDSTDLNGLFPCDIYVGGNFQATIAANSVATNVMWYDYSLKVWNKFAASVNVSSISVIQKNEFQLTTSTNVYLGGSFSKDGTTYSFAIYDTKAGSWTPVAGPVGVTDIFYNPNVFSTDNIFIAAASFTGSAVACKGVCNYNHKTGAWTTAAGSISTGTVNKISYIKGLSASGVGTVFVGGAGMTTSNVQKYDDNTNGAAYSVIGTGGPTDPVLGMDICGLFNTYSITKCKEGSVAAGGQNFLKFYDSNVAAWKNLLNEAGNNPYRINSVYVKISSGVSTTVSIALMAIIAVFCLLF